MGLFGLSQSGKNAQNALNGNAAQNTQWAQQWGNNSADQTNRADNYGNNVWAAQSQAASDGLGGAGDAHNAGEQLLGDQSGDLAAQSSRLNDLQSYYGNNYASPNDMMNGVRGGVGDLRSQQGANIGANLGTQNSLTNGGYDAVRGNTNAYASNTNALAGKRQGDLSQSTNSAYNAMADRVGGTDQALIGRNNTAYGGAQGIMDQSANRLTSAMDLNGASQMRATAPLMASAQARMRAAGVDPNSPEGASLMDHVDQTRAHALDDGLANNIAQQNAIAGQKAQYGLDQEGVNRGLAQDQTNQTNQIAAQQNQLGRADTNQAYDTQADTLGTQLNVGNNAAMGQYQDTRQNTNQAYQDQQNLAGQQANDVYNQAQMQSGLQQQDYQNQQGMAQAQNNVNQQAMQYKSNAGQAGGNWANSQFNAQQQGRNAMQNQYGQASNNALGWAGQAQGANNAAQQGYGNVYNNESANSNWLGKGLMGIAGSVAGAAAGGLTGGLLGGKKSNSGNGSN